MEEARRRRSMSVRHESEELVKVDGNIRRVAHRLVGVFIVQCQSYSSVAQCKRRVDVGIGAVVCVTVDDQLDMERKVEAE